MIYKERIADGFLKSRLVNSGAVLIEGPRGCGKATTASQQSASSIMLTDPNHRASYVESAKEKPYTLLKGQTPRLVGEWQTIPDLWKDVKASVKRRTCNGNYILTESQDFDVTAPKKANFEGLGRLRMHPMSLYESGESTGAVSLNDMFDNLKASPDGAKSYLTRHDLAFAACRGGWPAAMNLPDGEKLKVAKEYLARACDEDINKPDNVKRSPQLAYDVVQTYSEHLYTKEQTQNILAEVREKSGYMAYITLKLYMEALQNIFVFEEVPAWRPNVHHWSSMRHRPTRCLSDPSLGAAALNLTPDLLVSDSSKFSSLFKVMCVRDLRVYAQKYGGLVANYEDRFGVYIDAVVYLPTGFYVLVQFATNEQEIERGAKSMLNEYQHIAKHNASHPQEHFRMPAFMMILTPGDMAYTRPDGIRVVPLGCLKD